MEVMCYPLKSKSGEISIDMPIGAEIIEVKGNTIFYREPCIFALIDENAPKEKRTFFITELGIQMKPSGKVKPLGSAVCGSYIYFIFEIVK